MIEVLFDSSSKIVSHYKGRAIDENFSPSLATIKFIAPVEYAALVLMQRTFPEFAEVGEDFTPALVVQQGGAFKALYGPTIRQQDGQLYICAGLINSPLSIQPDGKTFMVGSAEVDIDTIKVNGYDNLVMSFTWVTKGDDLTLYVPLGMKPLEEGEKEPTTKAVKSLLKTPEKLAELLMPPPKAQNPTIYLKYLPEGTYQVIGFNDFMTQKGEYGAKLTILGALDNNGLPTQAYRNPTKEQEKDLLNPEVEMIPLTRVDAWAHRNDLDLLRQKPVISPEFPAQLVINRVQKSRNGNGYSVNCGLILHPDCTYQNLPQEEVDLSILDDLL